MKARLYWMIFAVIFCLATAMGLQSYIQLKANIMQEVPQRQNAVAHTVAMVVESFILRQAATIENLADRDEILLSTKTFNHTPGINLLKKYNAEFDKLSYISRQGRLLYSVENSIASQTSTDLSNTPFYRYMRQYPNEVVIDVLPAEQQIARNVIRMGIHKVNYFDKPLHTICAEINPLALDKLLNLIDTGPDTAVLVVNEQGFVLSKKLNSLQAVPDKTDTEKLMTMVKNPAGAFENRLIRLRNTEHLVNGYSLETLNWRVILITPTQAIYAPLKQLLTNSVLTVLLVLLIGMLLALIISRNIFKPIAMLTHLADNAADNLNLEERLRWHKHDELGSLAGTFNKMLDRLQHAFATVSNHQSHLVAAQELAKVGYFQKLKHSENIQLSFELTRILQTNPETLCSLLECIHHEDRCALKSAIQETIASKQPHFGKCRAISPDKKSSTFSTT
ncbi:HAMP domain-containing protein [Aliamphritea spongicola]|nr:HAMP domain-containing protein [Aliamphritea spongicola]